MKISRFSSSFERGLSFTINQIEPNWHRTTFLLYIVFGRTLAPFRDSSVISPWFTLVYLSLMLSPIFSCGTWKEKPGFIFVKREDAIIQLKCEIELVFL